MNPDKIIIIRQQKRIEELEAELTYWKETANHYKKAFHFLNGAAEYLERTKEQKN